MKDKRILRLYLQGGWPRQGGSCPWVLLTPDMRVVERGAGEARDWPPSDECEAIVTADQVSWLSVSLPEKLGRDANQIIAYALEEKLLEPPETMHFVVPGSAGQGRTSAIAIGRQRMKEILDAVSAAGRRLDRLFAELQLAPLSAGQWALYRFGESAFLRTGAQLGLAIDWADTAPPDALMLALAHARARGELPDRLVVATHAAPAPDLDAWSSTLGVPVTAGARFDPLVASTAGASNLLTGSFAPPGKTGFVGRYLRISAVALLLAGVGHTLLSLADWVWLARQSANLREEATTIYREAIPGSNAPLLNPSLQLQREVAGALRQRGRVGGDDMLTMLALLANELPPETRIQRIQFDRASLEIVAVLPGDSVRRIDAALRIRGYATDATALRQDATGTDYKIRMYLR